MFGGFYYEQKLNYSDAFALEFFCTALAYACIGLFASLIFYGISIYVQKRTKQRNFSVLQSFENREQNSMTEELSEYLNEGGKDQNIKRPFLVRILRVLSVLAFCYGVLCILIGPSIFSGLGVIAVWASGLLTLTLFMLLYVVLVYFYSPNFLQKNREQNRSSQLQSFKRRVVITTKLHKIAFISFTVFAGVYSITVPLITEDTCMDFFNEGYGVEFEGSGLSTRFSRYFQIDTACPQGQICHLYATLPEDGSSSTILNVHTGTDVSSIIIGYDILDEYNERKTSDGSATLANNITAQSFYIDLEERGARYLHSAFLHNLTANKLYYFEVYFNDKMQRNGTYQTLPTNALERNLTIAVGGDAGTSSNTREMTAVLGAFPLDAIVVGGDVAYDNGMRSCYYSFDLFLRMFESVNQKIGRVVPMIFSVGNHDVGFNAFQNTKIDISQNLFFTYFPQQSKVDTAGNMLSLVPELSERTSYNYHRIGNTLHFSLDSGYILPHHGVQTDFIQSVSKSFPNYVKMANFHVPMYPACFDATHDDIRTMEDPASYWSPLFDQHKFASVFEHHVHMYKKTYPVLDGAPNPGGEGVVYFGDGNWGISPNECLQYGPSYNQSGILEVVSDITHVWIVNITQDTLSHYAVNKSGQIFDQVYNFTVSNYISN